MIFRPEWEIVAQPHYWADDTIVVSYRLRTVDTSQVPDVRFPPDGKYYTGEKMTLGPVTADIDVRGLTEDGVLYRVLQYIEQLQRHEDREFMRVWRDGRWVAPFHPHTYDGQVGWNALESADKRGVLEYAGNAGL
jgi:hypothetical protein